MIPEQEINATERDQFWQREEMEEKKRLEQERAKCEQERQRLEQEIRTREEKEALLREQQVNTRIRTCNVERLAFNISLAGCPMLCRSLPKRIQ